MTAPALGPLFTDIPLCADDAMMIAGALQDIAQVDGTHPAEEDMIRALVSDLGEELDETLTLPTVTPESLALRLTDPELRTVAIQTCVLLALADGKIGDAERARVRQYATALGFSDAEYTALEATLAEWAQSGDCGVLFD